MRRCSGLLAIALVAFLVITFLTVILPLVNDSEIRTLIGAESKWSSHTSFYPKFYNDEQIIQNQIVYVITPTYARLTQKSDLINLRSTLENVKFVHWIVVEDSEAKNPCVTDILRDFTLPYTHLAVPSPRFITLIIKGCNQRNAALQWLRTNRQPGNHAGVVYFADDDNTYDPKIFREMRTTRRGSTWPVGFAGGILWEGCVTDPRNRSTIINFWALFRKTRQFPIDMAGFAVNLKLLFMYPDAKFEYSSVGQLEGLILSGFGFKNAYELEPIANGCTEVLVWHRHTMPPKIKRQKKTAPLIDGCV